MNNFPKILAAIAIGVGIVGAGFVVGKLTTRVPVTYYVDPTGNDSAPGTQATPWASLTKAINSLAAGDTVIFNTGVYALDHAQTYVLGPSGSDVNHKTTYKAALGARPIFTDSDGTPPNIVLRSYMHVEGIWFIGSWNTAGIDAFGKGEGTNPNFVLSGPLNDVIGNTFVGYGNVCCGGDYLFFQGNRSVRTGDGDLGHGLYLSGHDGLTAQEDNHAIVDNNIFVGQEVANPFFGTVPGAPPTYLMGLGIQVWHTHHNAILTRNFVAHHIANTIEWDRSLDLNTRTELVANNFWYENGAQNDVEGYPHGFWIAKNAWYINNLGGPRGGLASFDTQTTAVGNTILTNAFTQGSINHLIPFAPETRGLGALVYTPDGTAAAVGTTPQAIDNAISALQNSFAIGVNGVTAQTVLNDQTIEPNFAALHFHTPSSSPLAGTGTNWTGSGPMNIGPDIPVPASAGGFWAAFRALGTTEFGDCDQRVSIPYPNYPYPDSNNPNPTYNPACVRGVATAIPVPTNSPTVSPTAALPLTSTPVPTVPPTAILTSTATITNTPTTAATVTDTTNATSPATIASTTSPTDTPVSTAPPTAVVTAVPTNTPISQSTTVSIDCTVSCSFNVQFGSQTITISVGAAKP
jgi:hypothetical protein